MLRQYRLKAVANIQSDKGTSHLEVQALASTHSFYPIEHGHLPTSKHMRSLYAKLPSCCVLNLSLASFSSMKFPTSSSSKNYQLSVIRRQTFVSLYPSISIYTAPLTYFRMWSSSDEQSCMHALTPTLKKRHIRKSFLLHLLSASSTHYISSHRI